MFQSMAGHAPGNQFYTPGTVFGGAQTMMPNTMYGGIGMQPGFQSTQGQFGMPQTNFSMAGITNQQPYMASPGQLNSGQGTQMNPNSVPMVQSQPYDNLTPLEKPTPYKEGGKVLVLNEVDRLSKEAQHSLRRTMEKYSSACRLILCCNSASKVIEAVRSRCLNIRISGPSKEDIVKVLQHVAKKEGLQLPVAFAARIALSSNRNLRRAILSLEACKVHQYPFTEDQPVLSTDWEQYVVEIASDIVNEQSPKRLFLVRGKLYELLVNCIPPEIVLKRLLLELLKKLDSELKHEVCHWAAYYEHRMQRGQKAIFHLEAFVAKFMSIYKRFLTATFG
ncbi:hypothetical protein L7F22_050319 [Adiantum nelumboides]|nr:hypothetical protein [Adiantum nelumboides]